MSDIRKFVGRLFAPRRDPGRVIISGTGRAGTTFLIQLLTDLGLDTGFADIGHDQPDSPHYAQTARAGFEWDLFDKTSPGILKSPFLCDHVDEVLASGIAISHVIIPFRKLSDAAASRKLVQARTTGEADGPSVAGGLWGTEASVDQEAVLREKLARLLEALVRNDIPFTFLYHPRFVLDPSYTYDKLAFLLGGISRQAFTACFGKRSKPDWIHDFTVIPPGQRHGA